MEARSSNHISANANRPPSVAEPRLRLTRPFRFGIQFRSATSPSAWIAKAQLAEKLGYSVVSMPDHIGDHLAPIAALTAVALSTTTVRLGTMVVANDFRNPVLIAREVATLDWLSSGRFEFGIGAGWQPLDYRRLGIGYDSPSKRVARLAEAIDLMKRLLSGETVTWTGRYYDIEGATCEPRPVQSPWPPFVVGGGSQRILSLAGRAADIVNVHTNVGVIQRGPAARPDLSRSAVAQRVEWVRSASFGRTVQPELGLRIPMVAVNERRPEMMVELGRRWGMGAADVPLSPYALVGDVASIVDKLLELKADFGFTYFVWDEPALESMAPVIERFA